MGAGEDDDLSALDREVALYLVDLLKTDSALRASLSAAMADAGGLGRITKQLGAIETQLGSLRSPDTRGQASLDQLAQVHRSIGTVQTAISALSSKIDTALVQRRPGYEQPYQSAGSPLPERSSGSARTSAPEVPSGLWRTPDNAQAPEPQPSGNAGPVASGGTEPHNKTDDLKAGIAANSPPEPPAEDDKPGLLGRLRQLSSDPTVLLVLFILFVVALVVALWSIFIREPAAAPADGPDRVVEKLQRDTAIDTAWDKLRSGPLMQGLKPVCPQDGRGCSLDDAMTRENLAKLPPELQRDAAAAMLAELIKTDRCELAPAGASSAPPPNADDQPGNQQGGAPTDAAPSNLATNTAVAAPDVPGKPVTLLPDLVACLRAR